MPSSTQHPPSSTKHPLALGMQGGRYEREREAARGESGAGSVLSPDRAWSLASNYGSHHRTTALETPVSPLRPLRPLQSVFDLRSANLSTMLRRALSVFLSLSPSPPPSLFALPLLSLSLSTWQRPQNPIVPTRRYPR